MEQLMRLAVFIGGVSGVIPFQSPLIPTCSYEFKWFSLKTFYCILGTGLSAFINLDYILNNGMTYFKGRDTGSNEVPQSLYLTNIVMITSLQFICIHVRILCLWNSPGFFKILRNIEQIRAKLSLLTLKSCVTESKLRCIDGVKGRNDDNSIHCIDFDHCGCTKRNNRRCKKIFFCLTTFVAGLSVCINQAMQIKNYMQMYLSGDYDSWWLPRSSPVLAAVLEVIPDFCYSFIITFAVFQFVFLTLILLDLYTELAHALHFRFVGPISDMGSPMRARASLGAEILELLKESLNLLNDVCGYNIVILITVWTFGVTWVMIGFSVEGPSFGVTALLSIVLHFVIISDIGEHFKVEMRIAKESLESCLIRDTNTVTGDTNEQGYEQMARVIQGFLKWEWKLEAKGFYPIDHSLIPMVVAACFTYMIFVFQLRMTE